MLSQVTITSGLPIIVSASIVISLALSPVFTLTTDLIVGSAPPEKAGAASGISETGSELGGSLGLAVLGSIGTAMYRSVVAKAMPVGIPVTSSEAALDTLGGAVTAAGQIQGPVGLALLENAREAFIQGMHLVTTISAVVAIVAALAVIIALRHVPAAITVEEHRDPGKEETHEIDFDEQQPENAG